jgi:uncharacterized protein YodC (DUF2158 family)
MASEFKVGDIVKLKSGGPEMTVEREFVNYDTKKTTGRYECQWFAGKKLESGQFQEDSLELAPAKNSAEASGSKS